MTSSAPRTRSGYTIPDPTEKPAFVKGFEVTPAKLRDDHFGPVVYKDKQHRIVARVRIQWNDGKEDVEEYHSIRQARDRFMSLNNMISTGVSRYMRSVSFEEVDHV